MIDCVFFDPFEKEEGGGKGVGETEDGCVFGGVK